MTPLTVASHVSRVEAGQAVDQVDADVVEARRARGIERQPRLRAECSRSSVGRIRSSRLWTPRLMRVTPARR